MTQLNSLFPYQDFKLCLTPIYDLGVCVCVCVCVRAHECVCASGYLEEWIHVKLKFKKSGPVYCSYLTYNTALLSPPRGLSR